MQKMSSESVIYKTCSDSVLLRERECVSIIQLL